MRKKVVIIIFIFLMVNIFAQNDFVKIYTFKSAIVQYKYEASVGGTHIKYIDDYGYKQADYIRKETNFGGNSEKEYETIILIGEKAYTINHQEKTIAVGRNESYNYYLQNQDRTCTEISEAMLKSANGYKQKGTIKYLGKQCKKWDYGNGKGTQITWQGLMLKSEVNLFTMMVEKAVKIQVNKTIPESKFEIPQEYKYISSDVYQGFAGLELKFQEDKLGEEVDNTIAVEFSTSVLGGSNNFEYFSEDGEKIEIQGINDYNKVDEKIIKSQEYIMSKNEVNLGRYTTLIFKTNNNEYGKMQIKEIDDSGFQLRFVIFNDNGAIKKYSDGTDKLLENDFDFKADGNNSKLIINSKGGAKCFILEM
ncbi:MAG: hypothetical protein U9N76_08250 [Candidatus Marinimicrobia bacterium]|nr:hypothetical protein [Candidatus Neomarinimicrobiota bacterium]